MIEVQNFTKRYGDVTAVDDLSFRVSPGCVTGFLGPNGSGKTTTMRMLLGLDTPTAGQGLVNGKPYREYTSPLREVGALLDPSALSKNRSAQDHLIWLAQAGGVPRTRVPEILDLVGLTEVKDRIVGGYSLGMRQRLGIAAALLGDPKILMLDEPLNGLDPEGILWMRNLLQDFAAQGRTVFLSSHLMNEMEATADHVLVIGAGRLIADTGINDLLNSGAGGQVSVAAPRASELARLLSDIDAHVVNEGENRLSITGVTTAQVGELAARHGLVLHELVHHRPRLEEAFMHITRDQSLYKGKSNGSSKESQRS